MIFELVEKIEKKIAQGMTQEQAVDAVETECKAEARANAKKKGKDAEWGECESCGQMECLVVEVGLCGPCCFGEADTAFGNW